MCTLTRETREIDGKVRKHPADEDDYTAVPTPPFSSLAFWACTHVLGIFQVARSETRTYSQSCGIHATGWVILFWFLKLLLTLVQSWIPGMQLF